MLESTPPKTKDQIISAFGKLLTQYQKVESKIATKEQEAEKVKNQNLLIKATEYTVNNIVNGMASLQLDFGSAIDEIKEKLIKESIKLDELKKAIFVEKEHLQQLCQVRLIVDASHILKQEHQEKLKKLANESDLKKEKITQEVVKTRKIWEQEKADYLTAVTEEDELRQQQREQEEADYQYELARQRKIKNDEYEEDRRQQERELAAIGQEKEQDWAKREQSLMLKKAEHTKNKEKIARFEETINTEYNKAKAETIKEASAKAKVNTDLLEKEWETAQKGYNFQIESLKITIARQEKQIEELIAQLQESNSQAQNLALRAFNN